MDLTDYHYEQGRKLSLSIKKLSRLPISFEEARRIANKQQLYYIDPVIYPK